MTTWIALFRGINVGGHQMLPMAALRTTLERAGLQAVRSYIQSGCCVSARRRATGGRSASCSSLRRSEGSVHFRGKYAANACRATVTCHVVFVPRESPRLRLLLNVAPINMRITCDPMKRRLTLQERGLDLRLATEIFSGFHFTRGAARRNIGMRHCHEREAKRLRPHFPTQH